MAVRTDAGRVSSPFLGISPLFFGPSQIRASLSRCQGPSGKSGVAAWKPLWRLRGFLPVASGPTAGRAVLGNKALPPPWPRGCARLSFLPDPVTPCALPSPLRPSPRCSPSGSGAALPPLGSSAPPSVPCAFWPASCSPPLCLPSHQTPRCSGSSSPASSPLASLRCPSHEAAKAVFTAGRPEQRSGTSCVGGGC